MLKEVDKMELEKKERKNVPVTIYIPRALKRKLKLEMVNTETNFSAIITNRLLQSYEQK